MPKAKGKSKAKFDYSKDYAALDLRKNPELYRTGLGEQGVFHVQPYKEELLPLWRFATPAKATESSEALRQKFDEYKQQGDYVGCDMARKFIQMGFTRARRYANYKGGRKRKSDGEEIGRAAQEDEQKAESAAIFKRVLEEIKADPDYIRLAQEHTLLLEQT